MSVTFFEENHEYRNDEGEAYQSVSEFLSQFKKPFPKDLIAGKTAEKEGKDKEEILYKWDLNSQISCDYGNSIHKGIEYWIRFGEFTKLPHVKKAVKEFAKKYDRTIIHPEVITSNDELKVAGTIDQLHKLGKKKVGLTDVKTNGELNNDSRGFFLPPVDNLPDSKINGYRLQLSTYKWLLEQSGIAVEWIRLEHWTGTKYNTIEIEPVDVALLFTYKPKVKKTVKI